MIVIMNRLNNIREGILRHRRMVAGMLIGGTVLWVCLQFYLSPNAWRLEPVMSIDGSVSELVLDEFLYPFSLHCWGGS